MADPSDVSKHRTFKQPTTVTMGFGIGKVANPAEKRLGAIEADLRSGISKRIIVSFWNGQNLMNNCTSFEKKEIIPYLDKGKITPVVEKSLHIIGWVTRVRGDNVWIDHNFVGTLEDIRNNNVPVFFARDANAIFVPGFKRFTMDDWITVFFDINGGVLDVLDFTSSNIESSFLQADDIISIFTGTYGLKKLILKGLTSEVIKDGIRGIFIKTARKELSSSLSRQEARALVETLRNSGHEVIVNVGGEAAEHEAKMWPKAINVNIVTKGRTNKIPRLIRESGEDLDKIFYENSIDKVVSSKLPTSVDPAAFGKAAAKVLKSGGKVEVNIFGSAVDEWSNNFINALVSLGIKRETIVNISGVLIKATK